MKIALLALFLTLIGPSQLHAETAPLVAVASSLRQVWPLLMNEFAAVQKPRVTFGSSGNLARQIIQGAPFDMLLSADAAYTSLLVTHKRAYQPPQTYASGKLVWIAPNNTELAKWLKQPEESKPAFPTKGINRLAIANPAFAPYGQAAQDVLSKLGITLHGPIAFTMGENAVQALQFAISGATDGGIVSRALLSESNKAIWSTMMVKDISPTLHRVLNHTVVLVNKPSKQSLELYEFILSDAAQSVFEQHGFYSAP